MRNFKKFLTLVLAVMMVVSAMSFTTSAAQFEDVSADNEYLADAVDLLNYVGVAKGVSDTKFGTDELVTRQQFALFIYRLMKGGKDAPANSGNITNFKDLTDPTYNFAIGWAAQQGIVTGRSATAFDPKGAITLQEAYTMIVRALEYEADGEKLQYPFGYIEVAESEGVELAEGLASTVDYTDALTRGDMAIILYNAFFAEMGVAKVEYDEYEGKNDSYLIEKEVYPILCEEKFGVKQVDFEVVATPNYELNGYEATNELGYSAVLLDKVWDENFDKTQQQVYLTAEDLGVEEADLNDLFLARFELFVTHGDKTSDGNAYEIEKVLYAGSAMTKKTVNDIEFATLSSNKTSSYFDGTDAKLLSGKATADGEVIYFFDAPYSYLAPDYGNEKNAGELYALRNADNIKNIAFTLDVDTGIYTATPSTIIGCGASDYEESGVYADEAATLVDEFDQAYYGGLYEADIYDTDGDGRYEYINYKPYELFQVDTDDEQEFGQENGKVVAGTKIPVYYTNEANLLGEKFEDEDFVIGYADEATYTIKVAQVIKPVTATIKSYNKSEKTLTLSNDTTVSVADAWKLVANYIPSDVKYDVEAYDEFAEFGDLLTASNLYDNEINFYVYDGEVLHQEGAKSASLTFTNNLIIPTTSTKVNKSLDGPTLDKASGEMVYYIYAWVDGDLKWVPVETEDIYPAVIDGDAVAAEYLNQLCTYTVDADGVYTITSLENAYDYEDSKYVGINFGYDENGDWAELGAAVLKDKEDDDLQFIASDIDGVKLIKYAGTRFELKDAALDYKLNFTDYTKIIIRNTKTYDPDDAEDDEVEYIEFDVTSFNASSDVELNNVSYIVANDPDSTARENLVVLYAEATDFDLKGASSATGYRIIADVTQNLDENDYYRFYYTVYDPFTGKKTSAVAGTKSSGKPLSDSEAAKVGAVVELKHGKINENELAIDNIDLTTTGMNVVDGDDAQAGLVWIVDYNESDKILMVADVDDCWNDAEGGALTAYQVDNNTAVTMIKYPDKNGLVQWGSMSLLTTADLASTSTDYRCYNEKVPTYKKNADTGKYEEDETKSLKTGYAKYIKAYVVTENEDVDAEAGELNKVTMVVIVAHGGEDLGRLGTHTSTLHAAAELH